jgi:hypothetical protein
MDEEMIKWWEGIWVRKEAFQRKTREGNFGAGRIKA